MVALLVVTLVDWRDAKRAVHSVVWLVDSLVSSLAVHWVVNWDDKKVDCWVAMLGWMLVEMLVGSWVDKKAVSTAEHWAAD